MIRNQRPVRKLPCLLALLWLVAGAGYSQNARLSTKNATLTLDKAGNLTIRQTGRADFTVTTPVQGLWKLTLQNIPESTNLGPKLVDVDPTPAVDISQNTNGITLTYKALRVGTRTVPVRAVFRIFVKDEAFCFSGNLTSQSDDWLFRELTYPILTGIRATDAKAKVYLPDGLGQCVTDPALLGRKTFDYPSGRGTMQWLTINTPQSGFYVGSHDADRSKKQFEVAYTSPTASFSTATTFPVFNATFTVPDVLVTPYVGMWHAAAKRYRAWYDSQFTMPTVPDWVKQDAGWLLAILKQQNDYVMWRYDELDKLCDIADRLNLKTIGLFGWAHGGHDHLFPNWIPDELMGGRPALEAAIERAHKRGIKIVLYANATLIDASTEFYRHTGNEVMAIKEDKSPYTSAVRKYNSATPVVFVESSYSSKLTRKTMMDLALQAHELGADGILYDQAGVKGAFMNFSKLQDHTLPQESGTKYRFQMLNDIRTAMKKIDPAFIIMTEATNDGVLPYIDYHHGWGIGAAIEPVGFGPMTNGFPALYRYTFPELIETQRNASPMITRSETNFAAVYGLRHEIETRYAEDVAYLVKGQMPTATSYSDVSYFPPNPARILGTPADVATQYVHDLIQFENEHLAFLRLGKFVDEEGIQVSGQDITAKGFQNGNQLGVVVWNTSTSIDRAFTVTVPGYRLTDTKEPKATQVQAGTLLKANSIRLLIFSKE